MLQMRVQELGVANILAVLLHRRVQQACCILSYTEDCNLQHNFLGSEELKHTDITFPQIVLHCELKPSLA